MFFNFLSYLFCIFLLCRYLKSTHFLQHSPHNIPRKPPNFKSCLRLPRVVISQEWYPWQCHRPHVGPATICTRSRILYDHFEILNKTHPTISPTIQPKTKTSTNPAQNSRAYYLFHEFIPAKARNREIQKEQTLDTKRARQVSLNRIPMNSKKCISMSG